MSYIVPKKSLGQNFLIDKNILRKILDAFPGFSEHKIIQVLNGFVKEEFAEYVFDAGLNSEYEKNRHPDYTKVRLTYLWSRYLKQLKLKKKENSTYVESIGRLVWASILANNNDPAGIRSFKILIQIITNAPNGVITLDECEKICYRLGVGRFSQFISADNQRTSEIRFFESNDGKKIKINQNTINVYNTYIYSNMQIIGRKLGISI